MVGVHLATATAVARGGNVTRCGTARKARRVSEARRDSHNEVRGHGPDGRPEQGRTLPFTCFLRGPARPNE